MAQGSPSSGVTKNAQVQQDSLVLTVDNDFAGLTMRPAVGKLLGKHADTRVFFADTVHKVGRQGTLKPKAVLVTGKFMYVLDCDTLRLRAKVPIQVLHPCLEKDHLFVSARRELLANCLQEARASPGAPRVEVASAFAQRLDAATVREVSFYRDEEGLIHTRLVTKPVGECTLPLPPYQGS